MQISIGTMPGKVTRMEIPPGCTYREALAKADVTYSEVNGFIVDSNNVRSREVAIGNEDYTCSFRTDDVSRLDEVVDENTKVIWIGHKLFGSYSHVPIA